MELDTVLWLKTTPETKSPVAMEPIDIPINILDTSNISEGVMHTVASRTDIVLEEYILAVVDSNAVILVLNHWTRNR